MSRMDGIPKGIVHETDALNAAPWFRREPYLIFFPLGIALSWFGVGHWLLFSLGLSRAFDPVFHAMTQVQGFLMAFAVGFLFTMIPRRTGSHPPAAWEIAVCVAAPLITAFAAWLKIWHLAQMAWLLLAVVLVQFAVRRFTAATSRRSPPNGFLWIPLSIVMGVVGSILTGVGVAGSGDLFWLHDAGKGLVLEGMFVGLVLGVGGLAFPLMTRGQAPADRVGDTRDNLIALGHCAGAALLAATFFIEASGAPRVALCTRGILSLVVLIASIELWKLPDQPGWNRRLVWLSGWLLPVGYLCAAAFPEHRSAALHLVFVGCFATLALAVGTQVTLGHTGHRDTMLGKPWQVAAIGGLMLLATSARGLMSADPGHYLSWMAVAAAAFLAATAIWLSFLLPKMRTAITGDS